MRPSSHGTPHDAIRYRLASAAPGRASDANAEAAHGHRHQSTIGRSSHVGRRRANACRSKMSAPNVAAAGATTALVHSMSEGSARPTIQYGKTASAEPAG